MGLSLAKRSAFGDPSPQIQYSGLLIDSPSSSFLIPTAKIAKLLSHIAHLSALASSAHYCPVKTLAAFTDQVVSLSLALGPVTRLLTRAAYRAIESRSSWSSYIFLPAEVVSELEFWSEHITILNGFPFKFRLAPTMQVFSDAIVLADTGFLYRIIQICGCMALGLPPRNSRAQHGASCRPC